MGDSKKEGILSSSTFTSLSYENVVEEEATKNNLSTLSPDIFCQDCVLSLATRERVVVSVHAYLPV